MSAIRKPNWGRGDDLGTWAPIGGSGGEKLLLQLPSKAEDLVPVAATLLRGRINPKLRGYYGLVASLAGNHKGIQAFLTNMIAACLGERGLARTEYNMALARMLVPTSMPVVDSRASFVKQSEATKYGKKDGIGEDE